MKKPPASITCSLVVVRDSVRIDFMLAALHKVGILADDTGYAYLNVPYREKIFYIEGPEFIPDEGKTAIVVRALYGLMSSGASWRTYMAKLMCDMGFPT